ncbi:MAG: hypothetical protein F4Z15_05560 [Gammaproteobacteria bacterium]|nr:hypothetical protein [Gammaproteobacteria bacterium]MYD75210.1 hypothetical protein [Gammaproteobacteria bacterium]MYJ51793.1 hypothetical protein [Gammaproteobacteria bacterium]
MTKRNILIITTAAILAGSSIVYAGSKYWKHEHGHGHRLDSDHVIERIVSKMDRHLELSDQQEAEIGLILESNTDALADLRESGRSIRNRMLSLDPESESYQGEVQALANELAALVEEKTLATAGVVKEVYGILEPNQQAEAREILSKRFDRRHRTGE